MKHGIMPAMGSNPVNQSPPLDELYAAHVDAMIERHEHALEKAGADCAVIFSGCPKTAFLDDQDYPFVPNPLFLAWVPLSALPLSYIVFCRGRKPRLIYYQPHDYWHVSPAAPEGYWTSAFDIRVIHETGEAARHLPEERDKCIFLGEADDPAHSFGIERQNPSVALNSLHFARGIKTAYELACMRLASARAVAGHRAAAAAFREGRSEFAIHCAYCEAVEHVESELPYTNIIALNEHGAVLHYGRYDREAPHESRSLLIDAGASMHGYAADITRTYARADGAFADLIGLVDGMQQEIVGRIRAGVNYAELHVETHLRLGRLLVEAGMAKGDPETLLTAGVTSAFFPHGLGHLIGLQVHDVGGHMRDETGGRIDPPSGHPFLRLTRELREDMVLTVEPGLYVIDMLLDELRGTPGERHVLWPAVDRLRPFGGIRIEDDVRVLADGCENLTRDAFAA